MLKQRKGYFTWKGYNHSAIWNEKAMSVMGRFRDDDVDEEDERIIDEQERLTVSGEAGSSSECKDN